MDDRLDFRGSGLSRTCLRSMRWASRVSRSVRGSGDDLGEDGACVGLRLEEAREVDGDRDAQAGERHSISAMSREAGDSRSR